MSLKLWSGIVTEKLDETREFYVRHFGCRVLFDSEWFILLELGGGELGLLRPGLPEQHPLFRTPLTAGMWVAIDVDDVDTIHARLQQARVEIVQDVRDEPWGDRHFVVVDPNGIGVDVVQRRSDG
ncbi:glyoxalase/bleomycin resistance/extradiol dioxygenase family protein [Verticiella sediminum]|uniref:Glyoxalase/bleomycin resistance/extradiol dioxygenase family protein n=1 Tax=Verticiella sediminum TaxID=1247510 RepID=A0A556ARI9_9BURK|nr:VOC family protein [Verticiella sediminum]TSH95543.1 glyoxalase/bleomycin resistance/extradiol dioxygenase family protein [Verticiella sediminum]